MNVKYIFIFIKLFIKIKILRNNLVYYVCFLHCYDTMPFASTQHVVGQGWANFLREGRHWKKF